MGALVAYPRRGLGALTSRARARKMEAWPTCLVQTAELGDCEESSTLAWACCIQVLALLAIPKLLRDVPTAEAWPPSYELRQMAPRMIVPVAPPRGLSLRDPSRPPRLVACPFEIPRVPRGLLLVPSRSFASPSGVLLVPSRSFRVQRCGHDLSRVFPLARVAVVRSSGLLSRVRRVT